MGIFDWFKSNSGNGYITLPEDTENDNHSRFSITNKRRNIILYTAIGILMIILTVGRFHDYHNHHRHAIDRPHGGSPGAWNRQLMLFLDEDLGDGKPSPKPAPGEIVDVFDVYAPPEDLGKPVYTQSLMDKHVFENSYGKPFVATYNPPKQDFTHVRIRFNASTYGRQFDRLAHAYLGGSEIWRTSTAEPGNRDITFGYVKDVSTYTSLFKKSGIDFTFVLNNIVNDVYTGIITASLVVEYYNSPEPKSTSVTEFLEHDLRSPDDVIVLSPPNGLSWSAPSQDISSKLTTLPKDTARVVVDIFASGNSEEEFWYSHLLDPYSDWFPKGANEFGKHGPTRLVEVYVNGVLAGAAAPFPIIYTGGYSPPLWSKVVGSRAYDVPSYQIDLTPFLPYLWSSSGSTISLKIVNGDKREASRTLISEDWIVSANLLVWQVPGVEGSGITYAPKNRDSNNRIVSPRYGSRLSQVISFSGNILTSASLDYTSSSGQKESLDVSWKQKVSLANVQDVSSGGDKHEIVFSSSAHNQLLINNELIAASSKQDNSHGLVLTLNYNANNETFSIEYVRGYSSKDATASISSGQNGTSTFEFTGPRQVSGHGKIESNYTRKSYRTGEKYHRHVRAEDGKLIFDHADCGKPGLYEVEGGSNFVQTFLNLNGVEISHSDDA